jgi:hypothetical protein
MTQDEIIEMAIEAKLPHYWESGDEIVYIDRVTHFAKLVAQHERNEIIEILDASTGYVHMDAIRDRGQA